MATQAMSTETDGRAWFGQLARERKTTEGMTPAQWARVAELDKRLRRRDQRTRDLREQQDREYREREKRYTKADRAFADWIDRVPHGPATIGAEYASMFLRIPLDGLLKATDGAPFRIDFGRSWDGKLLTFFRYKELVLFAKRAGKPAPGKAAA